MIIYEHLVRQITWWGLVLTGWRKDPSWLWCDFCSLARVQEVYAVGGEVLVIGSWAEFIFQCLSWDLWCVSWEGSGWLNSWGQWCLSYWSYDTCCHTVGLPGARNTVMVGVSKGLPRGAWTLCDFCMVPGVTRLLGGVCVGHGIPCPNSPIQTLVEVEGSYEAVVLGHTLNEKWYKHTRQLLLYRWTWLKTWCHLARPCVRGPSSTEVRLELNVLIPWVAGSLGLVRVLGRSLCWFGFCGASLEVAGFCFSCFGVGRVESTNSQSELRLWGLGPTGLCGAVLYSHFSWFSWVSDSSQVARWHQG